MKNLSYKLSYYVLYVLFAAICVVLVMFYIGGEDPNPLVPGMSQPIHTETLLYLTYGLFFLTVAATVIAFLLQFGLSLKDSPVAALKSLIGPVLLVVVLMISWSIGSEEALHLPGYDGTGNVPFWLKITDMFIYSIYFLLATTIFAILVSSVKKKLS